MTPEQLQQLIQVITSSGNAGFNWVQGALALGATLVSVTGVVVGMRSAITTLSGQLERQGARLDKLTDRVDRMARELAVLQYAQGIRGGETEANE